LLPFAGIGEVLANDRNAESWRNHTSGQLQPFNHIEHNDFGRLFSAMKWPYTINCGVVLESEQRSCAESFWGNWAW
jgi:hypothetical protein